MCSLWNKQQYFNQNTQILSPEIAVENVAAFFSGYIGSTTYDESNFIPVRRLVSLKKLDVLAMCELMISTLVQTPISQLERQWN